ncbi:hypothetical protein [Streptomyces odontomachi]|uniref:hypothetical protein n=1 Tax=Streptomyces odontomachi TaxID=2944940 RepID=UPI00210A2FCE|nr:hypothetical protein [Streptomyces sp. ODS25]
MTADTAALRRALADQILDGAPLTDPAWRAAIEAVPRELFLDTALYPPNGPSWDPVRRAELRQDEWLRLVYSDTTWVTQVDGTDAVDATVALVGNPTSSSTLPSLMVTGDGLQGHQEGAEYDAVVATCVA